MDVEVVGRALSTLPGDDDHPYRTGPWRPQTTEWRADDLEVVAGEVPADLDGIYLRNTENPVHPAIRFYHPFDGDGMVHVVGFRDGTAFYRNRFVRTDGFLAEQEAGEALWAGIADRPALSRRQDGWGARTRMKDASSTDVVVHNGTALTSFWQCGDLYRLDPLTLDTVGKAAWGGGFPSAWGVSAHTKADARTGELLFFSYATEAPYLRYGVVDGGDRLAHFTDVPLPGARLPHDMAFTDNYAIFNDFPLFWDPELIARGKYASRFHPDMPSRIGVMPRRGDASQIRWFEADPTYVLHFTNAYEDGDEIVLDGFFQGCPEPPDPKGEGVYQRMFRFLALERMRTHLHRWRLDLATGRVGEERLGERFTEFGMINPEHGGRPYRYAYAATQRPGWFLFDGIVKHDLLTGAEERYALGEGVYGSETVMAPRAGSAAEDDGYLVTLTTDMNADASECLVFDAARLTDGPVARVRLPERISSGTHAAWAPGSALPRWRGAGRAAEAAGL